MTERQALLIAGAAHLVLLAALSLGFTLQRREFPVPEEIVPVEVVQISDVVKTTEVEPARVAPAPAPAAAEPQPSPEPTPPPPKAETPPPEPEPEPVKPAPPKPEAEKPAPAKSRPKLKPVPAKSAPPKPEAKRLDTAELSSLLDKTLPKVKARPAPSLDTAALAKSLDAALPRSAHADPRATATLQAAIRAQIAPCWNPPIGGADVRKMTVVLRWKVGRDGTVQSAIAVVSQTSVTAGNAGYARAFVETARRAVLRCQPLKLPAELYEGAGGWNEAEITFDPNELT